MAEQHRRASLRDAMTNWRTSSLPLPRRLTIALRNWGRRLRIPPRDCCGNDGEPGC